MTASLAPSGSGLPGDSQPLRQRGGEPSRRQAIVIGGGGGGGGGEGGGSNRQRQQHWADAGRCARSTTRRAPHALGEHSDRPIAAADERDRLSWSEQR